MTTIIKLKTKGDLLEPENLASKTLLRHLAEGMIAVTPQFWEQHCKPLANAHGWGWRVDGAGEGEQIEGGVQPDPPWRKRGGWR